MTEFFERITGNKKLAKIILWGIVICGMGIIIYVMFFSQSNKIEQPSDELINAEQPMN